MGTGHLNRLGSFPDHLAAISSSTPMAGNFSAACTRIFTFTYNIYLCFKQFSNSFSNYTMAARSGTLGNRRATWLTQIDAGERNMLRTTKMAAATRTGKQTKLYDCYTHDYYTCLHPRVKFSPAGSNQAVITSLANYVGIQKAQLGRVVFGYGRRFFTQYFLVNLLGVDMCCYYQEHDLFACDTVILLCSQQFGS